MRQRVPVVPAAVSILLAGAAAFLAGCTPALPDTKPPSIRWSWLDPETKAEGGPATGNARTEAAVGESYRVTLVVEDPKGVRQITLGGTSQFSCVGGGVTSQVGPTLEETDMQDLHPDSAGKVLTEIFLFRTVNFGPYACPAGRTFDGATHILFGTGANYGGQKVEAQLAIEVLPPGTRH